MTSGEKRPLLVLVGFSRDIERLLAVVDQKMVDVRLVHGKSDDGSIPSKADLVAYVWSQDTSWSTGLYSMFTYVHDFMKANEEYNVYLDGAVRLRGVMPSFPADLPTLPEERLAEQTHRAAKLASRIDEHQAIRLAKRALASARRPACDVVEARHDMAQSCWKIWFRPRLPGMQPGDIIDGGPVVLVDSGSGETTIVDMMSPG